VCEWQHDPRDRPGLRAVLIVEEELFPLSYASCALLPCSKCVIGWPLADFLFTIATSSLPPESAINQRL